MKRNTTEGEPERVERCYTQSVEQPGTLTPLAQVAAQLHELYTALQSAGFTSDEALRLVAEILRSEDGTTT